MNRRNLIIGGGAAAAIGAASYSIVSDMGSSSDYDALVSGLRSPLADPAEALDIIRYATLAANSHNTQPWSFQVRGDAIRIVPDLSRRTPIVDPDDHHVFVSLGCAAENLSLASAARGRPGTLSFDAADGGSVVFASAQGRAVPSTLFDAIPRRQSTRADYDGSEVSASDLSALALAGTVPGVDLFLITDRPQLDRLRDLVVAGNSAQMADPAYISELKSWLRFNSRQAMRTGDGLYSVAGGNPALPSWAGPYAFDWFTTIPSENDKYARQMRSSAGIAAFVAAQEDRAHWVAAGQACQRFALQATALGLKHAFMNQPAEVAALRPELAALVGAPGRRPDIMMRFGHGPTLPYSARRPVDTVIVT